MKITINGEVVELKKEYTLVQWAAEQNLPLEATIIEYNGEILPQEHWGKTILNDGDVVEIIRFVGGGC